MLPVFPSDIIGPPEILKTCWFSLGIKAGDYQVYLPLSPWQASIWPSGYPPHIIFSVILEGPYPELMHCCFDQMGIRAACNVEAVVDLSLKRPPVTENWFVN